MPKPYGKPAAPTPQSSARSKKRKRGDAQIDEITFDRTARHEYLTGFHKRKLARIKAAQEEAEKRGREERIEERRRIREARKEELKRHVDAINQSLNLDRNSGDDTDSSAWEGIDDDDDAPASINPVNESSEFVDEDKFTTVTVTTIDDDSEDEESADDRGGDSGDEGADKKKGDDVKGKKEVRKPKVKKKKFRYLSKGERKEDRMKEKARRSRKKADRSAK
ncbi:hypothetical protein ABW21_db0202651 [Orbilia brochopaga]|nr:hypothetical protein ABW21_db0202651 [Drechslerella brochopaga]